jgi:hypothetical protein
MHHFHVEAKVLAILKTNVEMNLLIFFAGFIPTYCF